MRERAENQKEKSKFKKFNRDRTENVARSQNCSERKKLG